MKISIIGAGTVGMTTARGLELIEGIEKNHHEILIVDKDIDKLQSLEGWNTSTKVEPSHFYFICTYQEDLEDVLDKIPDKGLPVIRSTVSVGTTSKLMQKYDRHILYYPEFLREATALEDFLNAERRVIGECCEEHGKMLASLLSELENGEIMKVRINEAELSKLICNAHLATKISFWNEIGNLCDELDIDFQEIVKISEKDERIGKYGNRFKGPYGGSCLPKDIHILTREYYKNTLNPILLDSVIAVNTDEKIKLRKEDEE